MASVTLEIQVNFEKRPENIKNKNKLKTSLLFYIIAEMKSEKYFLWSKYILKIHDTNFLNI